MWNVCQRQIEHCTDTRADSLERVASLTTFSHKVDFTDNFEGLWNVWQTDRKVDVRLPGKGNSNSHGSRPVHLIITMIKRIRTSRLSIRTLSLWQTDEEWQELAANLPEVTILSFY